MTFMKNLEDIKGLCRICLISCDDMTSLENKLNDEVEDSPTIINVLKNILMVNVENNTSYPVEVCRLCHGNLKILYDIKVLFNKSQYILKKYVQSLQRYEALESLQDKNLSIDLTDHSTESLNDETSTDDGEVDKILQNLDMPKKSVKVVIDTKVENSVSVKWLEGNTFIMEKISDSSGSYKCKQCYKTFSSREQLCSHMESCKKNIVCKYCNEKFYLGRDLRSHLKNHHGSKSPVEIKCEICDKTFKNHNARSYHKITRHSTEGKKYKCEICGKDFFFKNSLSQHLECHSRDVSRVICPICGKSFHYRGGLFYHMKIHRNERNYICSFCNGRFLNMASLKRHTRIHTGERPYKCSFCPKTFCSVSEVRTHERRHTGQKPHKCKYCKKSFITPYNLKLHISSHSGSQPCDICGKSYLNAEVLKFHMEMKHNIKDQNSDDMMMVVEMST